MYVRFVRLGREKGVNYVCRHMKALERIAITDDLTDEQHEHLKSFVCGALCNGRCKPEYIEKIPKS